MSMSSALANALTGLGAVGRSAQTVSSNISNALTEGYGRREIVLSSASLGGVRVDGEQRIVDKVVMSDRRLAQAETGFGSASLTFLAGIQDRLGTPDSPASLPGRIALLEGRLIEAASRPDSTTRLQAVAEGAADLARLFNMVGNEVQAQRQSADTQIGKQVDLLKANLVRIRTLNVTIARMTPDSAQSNALMDQRQQLIDEISSIVPIRQIERPRGAIALITTGGQILLDTSVAKIEFTASNAVTADMVVGGGILSELVINDRPIAFRNGTGRMDGGSLAGAFLVRDTLGPEAQQQIDDLAADLILRFQSDTVDPTLAAGDPGLFTDDGNPLAAPAPPGLAQRLTLDAQVDPALGEDVWRLRDGLNATQQGPSGDAALLQNLSDALTEPRTSPFGGGAGSAAGLASELMSIVAGTQYRAEQEQVFAQTRADTLRQRELAGGVDSDQEMQKLILIEQSYAANARVIQAVDEMLRRLTEI